MTVSSIWDDKANVEKLRQFHAAGLPSSEIARRFDGRVTRSAVCGKIYRLGLSVPAASKPRAVRAVRAMPVRAPSAPSVQRNAKLGMGANFQRPRAPLKVNAGNQVFLEPEARPARAEIRAAAWDALPGSSPRPFEERPPLACRWPIGPDLLSCCEPAPFGPYCEAHRRVAYASPKTNAWHLKKTLHKVRA